MNEERTQAVVVANAVLDDRVQPISFYVPRDPDSDAHVLARQYLRSLEKIERLMKICSLLRDGVTLPVLALGVELVDEWPPVIKQPAEGRG